MNAFTQVCLSLARASLLRARLLLRLRGA